MWGLISPRTGFIIFKYIVMRKLEIYFIMYDLYKNLYELAYSRLDKESRKSVFVCLSSPKYKNSKIRFMLVGRATNGWKAEGFSDAEGFARWAQQQFDTDRWGWIKNDGGTLYADDGDKRYYLTQSAFWNYSNDIVRSITGNTDVKWMESVAWSNLYKIAPEGWNPDNTSCKIQEDAGACRIILREIELLKPTHIFYVTGINWLFKELTEGMKIIGKGNYVEAFGSIMGIKTVVSCRPDYKKKAKYIDSVINAFNSLQ